MRSHSILWRNAFATFCFFLFVLPSCAAAQADDSAELIAARAQLAEAQTRQALAQAERAELLARLPPAQAKALSGSVDSRQLGAAGLARALDLALELAQQVCQVLPAGRQVVLYEPGASQGVVAARTVDAALTRLHAELIEHNQALQRHIDQHQGNVPLAAGAAAGSALLWLTAPVTTLRAGADLAALFKSDATLAAIAYGEGARALFATALARACPERLTGLGSGYLGELDASRHAQLLERVQVLTRQRAILAQHIATLGLLADNAKGDLKKTHTTLANAAGARLKAVDAFHDSLRAGEASDKSPLYTTARYLGYAERAREALVLDVDLRLEGLTLLRDRLFSGERLSLSGVALLWYRLHETDGRLLRADALRRISRPREVLLRGQRMDDGFWDAGPAQHP